VQGKSERFVVSKMRKRKAISKQKKLSLEFFVLIASLGRGGEK
jgi:hypothetical protein